jgi:hypothetical protein
MSESHFMRNALLFVVGLVVVGWLALELIGVFFHVFLYLAVGAIVVGGGMYLYGRAKRAIRSGEVQRRITRRY